MNTRRPAAIVLGVIVAALASLGTARRASAQADTVGDVIRKARRGEPSERLDATRKLGSYGDPRIMDEWKLVDVLLELVEDDDPRVARAAVRSLGDFARGVQKSVADRIIGPLAKIATDEGKHLIIRVTAIVELGNVIDAQRFEHKEGIRAVVGVASATKGDTSLRVEAFGAIGNIAATEAKAVVRKGLSDRDADVQEAAFDALRKCLQGVRAREFADAALGALMASKLRDPRASVAIKKNVLEILALLASNEMSVPTVEPSLIKVLEDEKDAGLVDSSVRAVGLVGSVRAAAAMVKAYDRFRAGEGGGQEPVRIQICRTAGTLFDYWSRKKQIARARAAAGALVALLDKALKEDASPAVKREAAVSLGYLYDRQYDKKEAVKTLIVVMGHPDMGEEIKSAALDSLEVLTRKSFGGDTDRWEEWYKKNQRRLAPGRP